VIVVDVNVVAYLLIDGDRTHEARRAWGIDSDWRRPTLLAHELLNVLATYEREGGLSLPQCLEVAMRCEGLFGGRAYSVLDDLVLSLASSLGLSAYDAQYLALAASLDTQLLTEDRALLERAPARAVSLRAYLEAHP